MTYFILNQGSFVRGIATSYSKSEVAVYVNKIIWYDDEDDEEMRAHLSEDKGKTICEHGNGNWLAKINKIHYFPDDTAAKLWWEVHGKFER